MAVDMDAFIRLLEEEPEQRRALRRALLGDEPDLAAALATLTLRVDALAEAQRRTEQQVAALAEAQGRTEQQVAALAEAQGRTEIRLDALTEQVGELAAAQLRTENILSSLLDVVKGMNDRVGKLDGYELERRYREKGHAYLSRIARRLQSLDTNTLNLLLDEAEKSGRVSPDEVDSILLADAFFTGRRRSDGVPVYLVIEASVTIARYDISRARERADLLARVVESEVLAVVGCRLLTADTDAASDDALRYLERCGLSRSQAIRAALVDFAEHRRREELVAEVKALASDEADQQEKATITALMDSLAVPVAHE